jgi:hypothetical protein
MKRSTFENRVSRYSKSSNGYKLALELLETGNKIYTCWTSGRGRYCTNLDYTYETIMVLRSAGLKENVDFHQDNDSPRGGKTGNHIYLTSKGRRKMIKN